MGPGSLIHERIFKTICIFDSRSTCFVRFQLLKTYCNTGILMGNFTVRIVQFLSLLDSFNIDNELGQGS